MLALVTGRVVVRTKGGVSSFGEGPSAGFELCLPSSGAGWRRHRVVLRGCAGDKVGVFGRTFMARSAQFIYLFLYRPCLCGCARVALGSPFCNARPPVPPRWQKGCVSSLFMPLRVAYIACWVWLRTGRQCHVVGWSGSSCTAVFGFPVSCLVLLVRASGRCAGYD